MGCLAKVIFKSFEQRSDIGPCIHLKVFSTNFSISRRIAKICFLACYRPRGVYLYRDVIL